MNGIKRIWLLGFTAILVAACGGKSEMLGLAGNGAGTGDTKMAADTAWHETYADVEQPVGIPAPTEKKIIRDGQMGLRVGDLSATRRRIDTLVRGMNGYYASETFQEQPYATVYTLTIRIPSSHFEKLIAAIEAGGGKVTYKTLYTHDVTEQYTDIEIRLANKRNYLKRYQELVRQAKSVKEVLEIEERIRGIEEEIDSAEGRLRLLANQVAYSTLELSISMPTEYKFTPAPQNKFSERFKAALTGGWRGVVNFVLGLLYIWPFLIIGTLLFVWLYERRKGKQPK